MAMVDRSSSSLVPNSTWISLRFKPKHPDYNPKYFPEPEEFRRSRWYGVAENDMTTFSLGPRTCIGRKFAITEGVAFLNNLLRDRRLQIVLNPGETKTQWRARVMKSSGQLILGVGNVPVHLTRR
ncbi:hypothetical protein K438DRAFT_1768466 [Mycena galopus ATCC 62051]|nr:hypothetical protein K438DRAFT_1768466 [Mycena galopus ATCC 62051]